MVPVNALVLFDIDGTLVRKAGPHHRRALEEAVRHVTGVEASTENVPVAGMLDRDIVAAMMHHAGVSATTVRRAMPQIVERAQRIYVRTCPDLRRKVCPGVRSLLRQLERRGVTMGLVTGNLTRIGWRKMERAGLRPRFRFGCFRKGENHGAVAPQAAASEQRIVRGENRAGRNVKSRVAVGR